MVGELDLDSGNCLRHDLHKALAMSDRGLDLDLSELDFCDCAGLGVLLELRRRALSQGKTVALGARSPIVDRLLTLLGAQELFPPPDPSPTEPQHPDPATAPSPKAGMSPGATSPRRRTGRPECFHTPPS
ncbi:STAS domain-containing protein [Streptomyces sp. NBC_00557]|nr:STAS domain-containing protein [Streptomyces sp. NBC_00557]